MVVFLLVASLSFILAQESGEELGAKDPGVGGVEIEKLVGFVNGILATILFAVTLIAFKRDRRTRLAFVSLAFALFAIRSFLVGYELFFPEIHGIDPITTILDFFVMLSFFYGVLKK